MDDVIVVGAGPYGLSIGAHLRPLLPRVRVLGAPMDSWRSHMPEGMFLKSTPDASSLSAPGGAAGFAQFRREHGRPRVGDDYPIPVNEFIEYGLWFSQRAAVPVEPLTVQRISSNGTFRVELTSGEVLQARSVVIASGHVSFAWVPPELRELYGDSDDAAAAVTHSADHADLSGFNGRTVAVIGGGQSALESAALLAEHGARVTLLVREDRVMWGGPPYLERSPTRRVTKPVSGLGEGWMLWSFSERPAAFRYLPMRARQPLVSSILGPFGAWWLRDRVDDAVDVRTGRVVTASARDGAGVRLDVLGPDGMEVHEVDHVIAATGYHVDIDRLEILDASLRSRIRRAGTYPALSAGFESSVPGLFFAGLSAALTFGPVMRFVYGAAFNADRVTATLVRRG